LFETEGDTMLWSGSFDGDAGMQSVFELQSEISRNISAELRASLSPDEAARMALVPTRNPAAYELFVKAANNLATHDYDALLLAREQFEQAIALDPGYARAQAGLAETVMDLLINHRALPADEAYGIAERAANLAIEADPGLADAYAVRGLIASRKWKLSGAGDDIVRAEADFRKALSLNPSLSSAYAWYAQLKEEQDQFDEAIDLVLRGLSVDPRNRITYLELPTLQALKGNNQRAIDLILGAMTLFPDWPAPYDLLARHLQKLGLLDEAVAWAFRLRELSNDPIAGLVTLATLRTYNREDLITKLLLQTPEDHPLHPIAIGILQYIAGDFSASIETLEKIPPGALERVAIVDLFMARAAIRLGDHNLARHYLLAAAPELANNQFDRVTRHNADEAVLLAYLADEEWEKAQRNKLLAAALETTEALPATGLQGYGIRDVQIYELQGHRRKALDTLQNAIDSGFVTEFPFDFWQIDENPILDSLRADPRYAALQSQMLKRLETMRKTLEDAQASGNWQAVRDLTIARSNNPASPIP
jgi:tetratricopeptide (TPR) repeat protein